MIDQTRKDPAGHLFVLHWQLTEFGGVNSVVKGLYHAMEGHAKQRPHVLLALWQAETVQSCPGYELSALRIRAPFGKRPLKMLAAFLLTLPKTLLQLRRLIKAHHIETINPHLPGLECFTFRIARRLLGIKLVISLHGSELIDVMMPSKGVERWWFKRLLGGGDYLVVPSHSLGRRLRTFVPPLQSRIRVVWNATEPDVFRRLASESAVELPPKPYLILVGGFELIEEGFSPPHYRKGQDIALQAWHEIRIRHPEARLLIVGTGGPTADWIRERVRVTPGAIMMEHQPDAAVSRLISGAAMLILPSRGNESFGIALIEAGSHAVPVISTTVDGIPEVVRDGVDGFLIPPNDPAALARAVTKLLSDPALAIRMGKNFQERVQTEFIWRRALAQYEDLKNAPRLEDAPPSIPLALESDQS